jgi:hypothetical protein
MTRYVGSASYFCCYPDPCGCDEGCCRGPDCSYLYCDQPTHATGACCTCNTFNWGYAWKSFCNTCCDTNLYENLSCGFQAWIGRADGSAWFQAPQVDHGPLTCVMVDLTKPLFAQLSPTGDLSPGIIPNIRFDTVSPG